uniref:PDZ domain-containing protein n=1 Tax=Cryptomonas curvata TaxID=233186 RepID=A0A7S0R1J7_9CRYP|mmetsp:Transcript_986/g.2128  ORF Transcript_986/g.2128 Transcript_986/m.2128 type:complete len:237 (+) Transcript_986:139-849(+)
MGAVESFECCPTKNAQDSACRVQRFAGPYVMDQTQIYHEKWELVPGPCGGSCSNGGGSDGGSCCRSELFDPPVGDVCSPNDCYAVQPGRKKLGCNVTLMPAESLKTLGHQGAYSPSPDSPAGSSFSESPGRLEAYQGIGIHLRKCKDDDRAMEVQSMVDGCPAHLSNKVFVGDIIIAVNGEDVYGYTLVQIARRLLGPAGTYVECTFQKRNTGEISSLTLQRGVFRKDDCPTTWKF